MMDGLDMGVMVVVMLVGGLLALATIGALVYFGVRAARPSRELQQESARALLDRRLATGEIEPEEYYEREAALRDAQPSGPRRGRLLSRS
jgi:uncharacterized membrane protein